VAVSRASCCDGFNTDSPDMHIINPAFCSVNCRAVYLRFVVLKRYPLVVRPIQKSVKLE
jgi:hypothetical protein